MALLLSIVLFSALPVQSSANNGFLHQQRKVLNATQKSAVIAAIEQALGEKHRHATEVRLAPLEALLAPTLNALPKNEHGKFGHKAVRYALHRLFVQRHAWFVKGIDGDLDNGESPTSILQDGVPDQIQTLFETRLGSHGLDAHEVAVMAATLENLAHAESMERLRLAYGVTGLKLGESNMTTETVDSLLDLYMAAYITGIDIPRATIGYGHEQFVNNVNEYYPAFSDVRSFVRQVRNESTSNRSILTSVDVAHVVTRIGDKYGRWQNSECEDLKRKLFAIEDAGTGRVALSKFYNAALNHGHWQFTESADYLRTLGALDESNPSILRVIVPNYILSPSNCVASSIYYSVCCLDECEDLVDHIEREIQAPAATAEQLLQLVTALPSPTTQNPPNISANLIGRLGEIAAANDGLVPLHGRMFAQWMHHVYPRECPFPHMSGSTNPMKMEAFEAQTGLKAGASNAEMEQCIVDAAGAQRAGDIAWHDADELYVERAPAEVKPSSLRAALRVFAFFLPTFSMVFFLLRLGGTIGAEASDQVLNKYV